MGAMDENPYRAPRKRAKQRPAVKQNRLMWSLFAQGICLAVAIVFAFRPVMAGEPDGPKFDFALLLWSPYIVIQVAMIAATAWAYFRQRT